MNSENVPHSKERESGLDVVRVFASFFVVAVHFYLNCGYYNEPMVGKRMFIMTFFRWFFMISVPLFIMLTGYLKSHNTISRRHYRGLIPVLSSYVLICIIKVLVANKVYGEGYYSFESAVEQIASYQMAWYVGMYVSLMLLIPFLNMLWNAIAAKRDRKILIASLAFVACLYPVALYVAPSYWQMLYPFVYYFLGCYIREYRPHIKKIVGIPIIVLITLVEALLSFFLARGNIFQWNILCSVDSGYSVITLVICTAVFFIMFYETKISISWLKKLLALISSVSLEIYLFTGIYDALIFAYLKRTLTSANDFFYLAFVTIPLNFVLSVISALIVKKLLSPLMNRLKQK